MNCGAACPFLARVLCVMFNMKFPCWSVRIFEYCTLCISFEFKIEVMGFADINGRKWTSTSPF